MARYRIDNKFLSEEEYKVHLKNEADDAKNLLKFWFGLLGLIIGGIASYILVTSVWHVHVHWVRFSLVIAGAFIVAYISAKLSRIIVSTLFFSLGLLLLGGLFYALFHFLWKVT